MSCPFFARKILRHASKFVKDVIITREGEQLTFVYTLQLFGTEITPTTIGKSCRVKNLWKKNVTVLPTVEDFGISMVWSDHPDLPAGTVAVDKWMFDGGDKDRLLWEYTATRPDMAEPCVNRQYFIRQADSATASKRASIIPSAKRASLIVG